MLAETFTSYYGEISRLYGGEESVSPHLTWTEKDILKVDVDKVNFFKQVRLEEFNDETKIYLEFKRTPQYKHIRSEEENVLIIDFLGKEVYSRLDPILKYVQSDLLESIALSYFFIETEYDHHQCLDLAIIIFSQIFLYEIETLHNEIVITVRLDKEGILKKQKEEEERRKLRGLSESLGAEVTTFDDRSGEEQSEPQEDAPPSLEEQTVADREKIETEGKERAEQLQEEQKESIKDGLSDIEDIQLDKDTKEKSSIEDLIGEPFLSEEEKKQKLIQESLDHLNQNVSDFIKIDNSAHDDIRSIRQDVDEDLSQEMIDIDPQDVQFLAFGDEPLADKLSLEECIQKALNDHLPAQIAIEKIKLAKVRLWEAKRNLFPQMNLEVVNTDGKVDDTEPFDEEEYKMSVDHNIYDGGERQSLVRQAEINLEVAKATYTKVKVDLIYDVEEAYYTLLLAKMNLLIQKSLLYDLEKMYQEQEIKYRKGLIRKVDFRSLKASLNQVQVQLATALKDIKVARLSLAQLIKNKKYDIRGTLSFKKVDIDLDDALWMALRHNAEYRVNQLMLEYQELERVVQVAKGRFKVDLSSRLGMYGSAYEEQDLDLDVTWYAGLRVSKVIGGSTLEANIAKEESSPRLGQTERGSNFTRSLKLTLLDSLRGLSDKKQADISFQEAVGEVGKNKKQIQVDLHNAFFDFQKAVVQLDAGFDKVLYREEELKVQHKNALLGDGNMLQVFESKVRLADEKAYYFQALSNYYIAIASINKQVGLMGYYR